MRGETRMRIPSFRAAVVILILLWLVLCKPWFWDGKIVPWDSQSAFYPFLAFVAQSLRSGELPLWNPFVYGGYPMISDPQAMIFSPIAVVSMLVVNQPSIHWFVGIELLHVLLAGLGMLLLSVRFGRSELASLFAALIYMYGGPASARLQHVPMILAYAWFPFALMALDRALDSRRMRSAVVFGVLAGIMAAHQNQVAYLFCLVLIGYVFYRAASSGSLPQFLVGRWRVLAASAIAGAVTMAVPLFFTLQFLPLSNRIQVPYETAISDSVDPLTLLSYFMRNFFGNARGDTYWGFGDVSETFLYAGTLPIVLVARYGIGNAILFERQFRFFFYVGLVSLLYALGGFTPFYWVAYHIIPGVDLYRRPTDATFILNMVLAMAAGFLLDRLLTGTSGRIRPLFAALGGGSILGLLTWGLLAASEQKRVPSMMKDFLLAVLFIGACLVLLRFIAISKSFGVRLKLALALLFLLAVDFGIHSVGSRMNAVADPVPLLMKNAVQEDSVVSFLRHGLRTDSDLGDARADITLAGAMWANAPMLLGIHSTQGYNPLRYALYDRVAGAQAIFSEVRPFTSMLPGYNSPMLNLLGVKYIVSAKSLADIDPRVDEKRFPLVFEHSGVHVWENPDAFPRVMAATSFYVESGKVADLDFRSTVVLSHPPATLGSSAGSIETAVPLPGQGKVVVRLMAYRNSEVTIAVESERDAIVILNDPWYPYWRAYVDGREREILQANYLFRGVHVQNGEHTVVFRFEPYSWSAIRGTFRNLMRQ